jgi:hypothetical protein
MALARTFAQLCVQITTLQEALQALGTTVEEDRPQRDDVVVASDLADTVLAVRGILEEARAAADETFQAVEQRLDSDRARRALTACQEQFHIFVTQFQSDLLSYERLDDLATIARERRRGWPDWVGVVREEIEQCRVLTDAVRDALFLGWQELVERAGTAAVSVQNTTIGQQISSSEVGERSTVSEGAT